MSCLSKIEEIGFENIEELFPNTLTSLNFSSGNEQLLKLRIPVFQTINFSVDLTVLSGFISVEISIFKDINGIFVNTGFVNLVDQSTTFSEDFDSGDYVICFHARNVNSYTGNVISNFTGYPKQHSLEFDFFTGEDGPSISFEVRIVRPCDEDLFYEIIDGELPPGLRLLSTGTILGRLPNLDCLEDDYSPSQNWYYKDIFSENTFHSWARQWNFRVRIYIASDPSSFDEEWFCIRVHNNWDFDRINFLHNMPFDHQITQEVYKETKKLPEFICGSCKPPEKVRQVLQQIERDGHCDDCEYIPKIESLQLIKIPDCICETINSGNIVPWFLKNKDKKHDNYHINKFIDELLKSDIFQKMLTNDTTEESISFSEDFKEFLQLVTVTLEKDNRSKTDLDNKMLNWRDQENQKLPITILTWTGQSFEINLS